jgi:hypothetical protein
LAPPAVGESSAIRSPSNAAEIASRDAITTATARPELSLVSAGTNASTTR